MYLVCLRMMYCMSDQFSELKSMLRVPSTSSVTSGFVIRDSYGDTASNSSDITSIDSEFTFPARSSITPDTASSLSPGDFQMIVHDLSVPEKQSGQSSFYKITIFFSTNVTLPSNRSVVMLHFLLNK